MSDDRSDDDPIMDLWYSNWEQQCVGAIEAEPDYESQLHNEKEIYSQQIWSGFQTTASAIAQLYKGEAFIYYPLIHFFPVDSPRQKFLT